MTKIINTNTKEQITLLIQHVFGRQPNTSHTILHNPDTSRMHATILWDGEYWLLQDSSRNGTYVNGKQVMHGVKERLYKGDRINFASLFAHTWKMLDVSPPKSLLVPIDAGLETIELDHLMVLPCESSPEITLYMSPVGHWICESSAGISILKTGDLIGYEDKNWRFIEARASDKTQIVEAIELATSHQIGIYFDVSQNEEHVSFKVKMGELEYDLGERNHHYLLLLLARKRMDDKAKGISDEEQGWIHKSCLCKMLGQNENHINIQVYRFRKQITSALPHAYNFSQAIESRTGEIRFAYDDIEISGGSQCCLNNEFLN